MDVNGVVSYHGLYNTLVEITVGDRPVAVRMVENLFDVSVSLGLEISPSDVLSP